jgi:hypothetical protein
MVCSGGEYQARAPSHDDRHAPRRPARIPQNTANPPENPNAAENTRISDPAVQETAGRLKFVVSPDRGEVSAIGVDVPEQGTHLFNR